MAPSIWTGAISFGLVQVPVRLLPATKSRDVSFNQLEEGSGSRIRYKKISENSGEEVTSERIVKGYEIAKDRYVIVSSDELAMLAPKAAHTIEIEEFVDLADIDPVYFEQPYYLVPEEKGSKPYTLLVDAMEELGKVAIGRVVIRSKERLVVIRPRGSMLYLETMRYADEVLDHSGLVKDPGVELSEREKTMALQLVQSLAAEEFDVAKYRDQYREQLLDLIERKASGEEIVARAVVEETTEVLDLVAALEESLARARSARDRHPSTAEKAASGSGDSVPGDSGDRGDGESAKRTA